MQDLILNSFQCSIQSLHSLDFAACEHSLSVLLQAVFSHPDLSIFITRQAYFLDSLVSQWKSMTPSLSDMDFESEDEDDENIMETRPIIPDDHGGNQPSSSSSSSSAKQLNSFPKLIDYLLVNVSQPSKLFYIQLFKTIHFGKSDLSKAVQYCSRIRNSFNLKIVPKERLYHLDSIKAILGFLNEFYSLHFFWSQFLDVKNSQEGELNQTSYIHLASELKTHLITLKSLIKDLGKLKFLNEPREDFLFLLVFSIIAHDRLNSLGKKIIKENQSSKKVKNWSKLSISNLTLTPACRLKIFNMLLEYLNDIPSSPKVWYYLVCFVTRYGYPGERGWEILLSCSLNWLSCDFHADIPYSIVSHHLIHKNGILSTKGKKIWLRVLISNIEGNPGESIEKSRKEDRCWHQLGRFCTFGMDEKKLNQWTNTGGLYSRVVVSKSGALEKLSLTQKKHFPKNIKVLLQEFNPFRIRTWLLLFPKNDQDLWPDSQEETMNFLFGNLDLA